MTRWQRAWPWLRRALVLAFFALVAWLLVSHAREVEWREVGAAIAEKSPRTLALVAALAALSYALYCSFDLMARRYTGHDVPPARVLAITFVSYAFNLNLGAMIGGGGFRYRLYSQAGLSAGTVSRVFGFSMLANWSGYVLLAGIVFTFGHWSLPADWHVGDVALKAIGAACLVATVAFVIACFRAKRREWSIRGHEIRLPSGRMALLQLVVSTVNWMTIATIVWLLLGRELAWPQVLGTMLLAAIAGVLTHVPAGLGVLEAVFIAVLAGDLPRPQIIAALLAYRGVYYIAPLLLALVTYVVLEARLRRTARGSDATASR